MNLRSLQLLWIQAHVADRVLGMYPSTLGASYVITNSDFVNLMGG